MSQRLASVDIARGIAVSIMILVHSQFFLSFEMPDYSNLWVHYFRSHHIFIPVSGISMYYWFRSQRAGVTTAKALGRGLFLFALGILLLALCWDVSTAFDWDILSLIGTLIWVLWIARHWTPNTHFVVGCAIILISPVLQYYSNYQSYWHVEQYQSVLEYREIIKGYLVNGYFPLVPFLGPGFLGYWFASQLDAGQTMRLMRVIAVFFAVGLMLLLHPWYLGQTCAIFTYTYYPATIPVLCIALAVTFSLVLLLRKTCDQQPEKPGLVAYCLESLGRRALLAYVGHYSILFLGMKLWSYMVGYSYYQMSIPTLWKAFFIRASENGALDGVVYRVMTQQQAVVVGLGIIGIFIAVSVFLRRNG